MFIVLRYKDADGKSLYDADGKSLYDADGKSLYDAKSIIGIYVDRVDAKTDLPGKLNELKYEYEYLLMIRSIVSSGY